MPAAQSTQASNPIRLFGSMPKGNTFQFFWDGVRLTRIIHELRGTHLVSLPNCEPQALAVGLSKLEPTASA